jgi:hypothetical protein
MDDSRNPVAKWWHEGESPGCTIYRQPLLAPAFEIVVVLLIILRFHFEPRPVVVFWLLVVAVDCGLCLRRAVVLDEKNVTYRPPVGNMMTIPLSEVMSVEQINTASTGTTFFQKPGAGIRISTLKQTAEFTVILSDSKDLTRRLLQVVEIKKPIS